MVDNPDLKTCLMEEIKIIDGTLPKIQELKDCMSDYDRVLNNPNLPCEINRVYIKAAKKHFDSTFQQLSVQKRLAENILLLLKKGE